MSDIRRVRETRDKDKDSWGDWDDWPYPTLTVESVVTGQLRDRILTQEGRASGEVRIVETTVSEGYSEFTQEDDCTVAVLIDGAQVWESDTTFSEKSAMAAFLKRYGDAND